MTIRWIALRVILEIIRDRRTVAFFLLVPVVVMTLIFYAVSQDETAHVGVVTRGVARLFDADLIKSLENETDIEVVSLDIPDEETDLVRIETAIRDHLRSGRVDAILYMDEKLLVDRFAGRRGTLHLWVEGSRPTTTATAISAIASAMDDLADALPVVIDTQCSADCANSVNATPMELTKHYLYGSEDYRMVDFFLPVFPPFFVFFFTFILSTITFQRERTRGTLERILIAPVSFGQVVLGYVGGFFLFSLAQAVIILTYIIVLLSFDITWAQMFSIAGVTLLMMLVGLMMGLLASFLAHNEFQAIQFIPLVVLPQVFLSDMIWDIQRFPQVFQWIAYFLPLTHANWAMRDVLLKNHSFWATWPHLLMLVGFFMAAWLGLMAVGRKRTSY
ncbi:MAG: ABC transporter permease [Deltaproteobacteria bacterium]|nr:ABC transporter permease [Deltaproteobacteria bacterium]